MIKKTFFLFFVLIGLLYAQDAIVSIPVNNNEVKFKIPDDGNTHVVYLPVDISLKDLQNSLNNNQTLIIYNLAAYSDWMKKFNKDQVPFIAAIKVTKDSITYLTKVNGYFKSLNTYSDFVNYMKSQNLKDDNGFSLDNYLTYFKEIKAGGVYYIKSSGGNLILDIKFNNLSSQASQSLSTTNGSLTTNTANNTETNNSSIIFPPSPGINQ